MSSTEQGLDTGVSGESTHHESGRTLVMEASQVDNAEVALQVISADHTYDAVLNLNIEIKTCTLELQNT
jgi:hypothetical protein